VHGLFAIFTVHSLPHVLKIRFRIRSRYKNIYCRFRAYIFTKELHGVCYGGAAADWGRWQMVGGVRWRQVKGMIQQFCPPPPPRSVALPAPGKTWPLHHQSPPITFFVVLLNVQRQVILKGHSHEPCNVVVAGKAARLSKLWTTNTCKMVSA
jgi:hypothetical protein